MSLEAGADEATRGAQRALAAIGHELASPLTALFAFLRAGKGDEGGAIRRCADRIQAIAELARELSTIDEPSDPAASNVGLALESAAAQLAVALTLDATGELRAALGGNRVRTITRSLLRAVVEHAAPGAPVTARITRDGDRLRARITPGIEPSSWRAVEPWRSGTGFRLDVWVAAVAAGEGNVVRVGDVDGQIAVEVELPAAGPR